MIELFQAVENPVNTEKSIRLTCPEGIVFKSGISPDFAKRFSLPFILITSKLFISTYIINITSKPYPVIKMVGSISSCMILTKNGIIRDIMADFNKKDFLPDSLKQIIIIPGTKDDTTPLIHSLIEIKKNHWAINTKLSNPKTKIFSTREILNNILDSW